MAALTVSVVLLILLGCALSLGRSIAKSAGLSHPFKTSLTAVAIGVSFELVLIAILWPPTITNRIYVVVANIALVLQVPGLLLSNMFGFGFHSEHERLKLFYVLMTVTNAMVYSFTSFAIYAFIERKNRMIGR